MIQVGQCDRDSYGNLVVINHQGGRQTRYAHLQEVNVTTGQQVKQGEMERMYITFLAG